MKLGTNQDNTKGVDEIRAVYSVTKDGYVLARQILLGWFKYENVTVDEFTAQVKNSYMEHVLRYWPPF